MCSETLGLSGSRAQATDVSHNHNETSRAFWSGRSLTPKGLTAGPLMETSPVGVPVEHGRKAPGNTELLPKKRFFLGFFLLFPHTD